MKKWLINLQDFFSAIIEKKNHWIITTLWKKGKETETKGLVWCVQVPSMPKYAKYHKAIP